LRVSVAQKSEDGVSTVLTWIVRILAAAPEKAPNG
jgi:hypothetical protein